MESWWRGILDSLVMGMVIPGLMLCVGIKWNDANPNPDMLLQPTEETVEEAAPQTMRLLSPDGNPEEMDMETYVTSVLLGEVPGSFEMEALKAQAVVTPLIF